MTANNNKKKLTLRELNLRPQEEQIKLIAEIVKRHRTQFEQMAEVLQNSIKILRDIKLPNAHSVGFEGIAKMIQAAQPSTTEIETFINFSRPISDWVPDLSWQNKKNAEESYVRKLQIELLEKQLGLIKGTPIYDQNTGILIFNGKKITIPLDTNMENYTRKV